MVTKELHMVQDQLRDAEYDIDVKNNEIKVLTNKYNILREDHSNLRLKILADREMDKKVAEAQENHNSDRQEAV